MRVSASTGPASGKVPSLTEQGHARPVGPVGRRAPLRPAATADALGVTFFTLLLLSRLEGPLLVLKC